MGFTSGVQAGLGMASANRAKKQQVLQNHINGYDQNSSGDFVANDYGKSVEGYKQDVVNAKREILPYNTSMGIAQAKSKTAQANVDTLAQNEKLQAMVEMQQQQIEVQQNMQNAETIKKATLSIVEGNPTDAMATISRNPILKQQLAGMGITDIAPINWEHDGALITTQLAPAFQPQADTSAPKAPEGDGGEVTSIATRGIVPETVSDKTTKDMLGKMFVKVRDPEGKWKIVSTAGIIAETNGMEYMNDKEKTSVVDTFNKWNDIANGKHLETANQKDIRVNNEQAVLKAQEANPSMTSDAIVEAQKAGAKVEAQKEIIDYRGTKKEKVAVVKEKLKEVYKDFERAGEKLPEHIATPDKLIATSEAIMDGKYSPTAEDIKVAGKMDKVGAKISTTEYKKTTSKLDTAVKVSDLATIIMKDPKVYTMLNTVGTKVNSMMKNSDINWETASKEDKQKVLDYYNKQIVSYGVSSTVASYLRAMSGLAVTDQEYGRTFNYLTGGNYASGEEVAMRLNEFSSKLNESIRLEISSSPSVTQNLKLASYYHKSGIQEKLDSFLSVKKPLVSAPTSKESPTKADKKPLSAFGGD